MHSQTQFIGSKNIPSIYLYPWLPIPLTDTLRTLLNPTMVNLQQQTDLQKATECPPTTIQGKQDRIPAPSCIQDCPQHLFPRLGDFARHIKRQRAVQNLSLLRAGAAKFNAIGRHTVTLHKHPHLLVLTDRTLRTQLWKAQLHCSHSHACTSSAIRPSQIPLVSCLAYHFFMQSISKPHNQHTPNVNKSTHCVDIQP